MDWSFFNEFDTFFNELGNFVTFLAEAFKQLPSIVTFVLSFIVIVAVIAGGLYMLFKLIG